MNTINFEQLLQPLDLDTFFNQYWEKQPLFVSRNEPDYYSGLISIKDIDTLLQFTKPKYPDVRLGKANKGRFSLQVLEGMNTTSVHDYGVPSLHQLYKNYAEGDTLLLNRLSEYWEPLAILCRSLEEYLNHSVSASIFLTPKNSQGFPPHFDEDGIFVLQLEGAKLWRLYNSSPRLYFEPSAQLINPEEILAPEQEIYLRAGDLLYIPAGCIHEVLTTESSSLHLAIGIKTLTWADLITSALASVSEHSLPFHEALPVGFLNRRESQELMRQRLADLLDILASRTKLELAVEHLARSFIGGLRPLPNGHFSHLDDLSQINLDTVVAKREGMICWIFREGDSVGIQFPGNEVKAPSYVESALRFIADTETFQVKSLPAPLSDNSKLVLVRRLIKEGLLTILSH